ncbi:MAG: hypothetical protein QNK37_29455 [Acidobacteriota bacterium]|nr:hypothetical protein [Acidobacteriota bacterium]
MTEENLNLDEQFKQLMETLKKEAGPGPGPDELLAYRQGALSEQEAEALREQLLFDEDAVGVLRDLNAFPQAGEPTPEATEEVEAAWAEFQDRLPPASTVETPDFGKGKEEKRRTSRWLQRTHFLWAAACLLLGLWGFQANRDLAALKNSLSAEPQPENINLAVTRSSGIPIMVSRPLLVLTVQVPNGRRNLPAYRMRLTGPGETHIQQVFDGPREDLSHNFLVTDLGGSGPYVLVVEGKQNGVYEEFSSVTLDMTFP